MAGRKSPFPQKVHEADFCVVGGGMAGLCAALAAARHGVRVVLMHDRPVLGGNASSECRVHICGADRHNRIPNMRETGILEELRLENLYRNPHGNFSVWDTLLYEKARLEENLTLLLNCSCNAAAVKKRRIESVTGWQMTTQTHHVVRASIFADCSGDAVLAPLTRAKWRMGREARSEYGESLAPEKADDRTMGMTCLFQAREYDGPQPFEPPSWAHRFDSPEELPYGTQDLDWFRMGYWWIELGGDGHSIHDTESVRDELLKVVYGVWDHIKNRGDYGAENWALEWVQFLPAKRESRRYVGAHVLTQSDVESGGRFDDIVAYGGWHLDDHPPVGFFGARLGGPAAVFSEAPSPYGIPYRSLHSKDIENLMFAGRCASASHVAMSSARVMGTGSSMGQAVGTAAALACGKGLTPPQVRKQIAALQQALVDDDAYIPGVRQRFSALTRNARLGSSRGDAEAVRDGISRPVGRDGHFFRMRPGDNVTYVFGSAKRVRRATLVLDSALERNVQMSLHGAYGQLTSPPEEMPESFHLDAKIDGRWRRVAGVAANHRRLVRLPVARNAEGVRYVLDATWGAPESRLFSFHVD